VSWRRTAPLLILALVAISWSGPLVRLAGGIPALTIAMWRTSIATAILAPIAVGTQRAEIRNLAAKDIAAMVGSGAFLALHFAAWITSISLTTIASSVLLVTTAPLFVAAASAFIGEPLRARGWLGLSVAVVGAALVAGADLGRIETAALGNLLALAGAATAAGYALIGRVVRQRVSLPTYATVVYGSCALLILAAALATGTDLLGFPTSKWLVLLAIVAGPQLIGHTTYNFLLDRLEAAKVTVATMAEPLGAAVIAAVLFGEVPGPLIWPGAVALLTGIGIVVTSRTRAGAVVPGG
jgi:drug/metabolite transporter (DMT)-like permease